APQQAEAARPNLAHQSSKARHFHRRVHHRPDAIVIKTNGSTSYADILKTLKGEGSLQQTVGSSVHNIRRSASGALVLQLKKGVENVSTLGAEIEKVLGPVATASARQHTSSIEIKDLDECVDEAEIATALGALLGVPVSQAAVKSLRRAYAGTRVAVVALPDERTGGLTALKLRPHTDRLGGAAESVVEERPSAATSCWCPGHVSANCKGTPTAPSSVFAAPKKGHKARDCKSSPVCVLCRERRAVRCRPWSQVHEPDLPSCPEDIPSPPMMRILQLNLIITARAAQDLLSQTMREQRINVAIVCDQYKNLDPPYTWLADANNQAAIWVHGGTIVQERPAGAHAFFTWARISGIYFFSVYAPPRLADVEFSALLTNIVEEAQGKRHTHRRGDFKRLVYGVGIAVKQELRATTLLDALAPLDAVLLKHRHPNIFLQVYTACLRSGIFPSCWKRQRLVLLPKPGKPAEEPSSYRPLCMLDTAGKILEKIIRDRLEVITESPEGLSDHQYGFRKGRSTTNAIENVIAVARQAVEGKRWHRGTKKYCAVVTLDVKNAFNSARWNNILTALRRLHTPEYLLRIINSYFSASVLDYSTDDGPESTESQRGVPQGSVLGPIPCGTSCMTLFCASGSGAMLRVRPSSPNRQRKGSKSGWSPREDHAPNTGGPRSSRRKLYAHVVDSILLYGAPIWSGAAEDAQAYIRQAESVHRRALPASDQRAVRISHMTRRTLWPASLVGFASGRACSHSPAPPL
ncbi:unnamed protein product, partial [Trichogramma brassicae]